MTHFAGGPHLLPHPPDICGSQCVFAGQWHTSADWRRAVAQQIGPAGSCGVHRSEKGLSASDVLMAAVYQRTVELKKRQRMDLNRLHVSRMQIFKWLIWGVYECLLTVLQVLKLYDSVESKKEQTSKVCIKHLYIIPTELQQFHTVKVTSSVSSRLT